MKDAFGTGIALMEGLTVNNAATTLALLDVVALFSLVGR